jgi:predicted secreted protein
MLHFLKKIILLIPLLVGCSSATTDSTQDYVVLSSADGNSSQSSVNLGINQIAVVKLTEAQGTGYTWKYASNFDLLSVKETTIKKDAKDVIGGSIERTWSITATAPGIYQLSFQYARAWEDQPLKKIDYTLTYR